MLIIVSSCKNEQSTFVLKCGLPIPLFHCTFPGQHFYPAQCHQFEVMGYFRGFKLSGQKTTQ